VASVIVSLLPLILFPVSNHTTLKSLAGSGSRHRTLARTREGVRLAHGAIAAR
jgi:hypothetical protein